MVLFSFWVLGCLEGGWWGFSVCLFLVVSIWVCRLAESALLFILIAVVRKNKHTLVISASSINSHLLRALGHVLLLALQLSWGCSNSCSSCPGSWHIFLHLPSFLFHPAMVFFFEQLLDFSFQVWKFSNPCFVENWVYEDLEASHPRKRFADSRSILCWYAVVLQGFLKICFSSFSTNRFAIKWRRKCMQWSYLVNLKWSRDQIQPFSGKKEISWPSPIVHGLFR